MEKCVKPNFKWLWFHQFCVRTMIDKIKITFKSKSSTKNKCCFLKKCELNTKKDKHLEKLKKNCLLLPY